MGNEIKTTAIAALSEEMEATGLVTEEAQEALKAKKLLAAEQRRELNNAYYIKGTITLEELEAGISEIQQETPDDTTALDDDAEILS